MKVLKMKEKGALLSKGMGYKLNCVPLPLIC